LKILITGGSSGIGRACQDRLKSLHDIVAPGRNELDLSNFEQIDKFDLSGYDAIINCAGANGGSYLGWKNNTWQNQTQHVTVNFTGALLLAKQYVKQRTQGQFVFITSSNIDDPLAQNIFYTTSKAALRYSMQTLRKEVPGIIFTEICPGKTRTNMLKQNYQGTKTDAEIDSLYDQTVSFSADDVARAIETAILHRWNQISLTPNELS